MKPIFYILLFAIILRVATLIFVITPRAESAPSSPFYFPDSAQYWELAQNLIANNEYATNDHLRAWRAPIYPLILAGVIWLSDKIEAINAIIFARCLNIFFDLVNIWLIWWLARKFFSSRTGNIAALLAAIYPMFIFMSPLILSDTLAQTTILLTIFFWYRFTQQQKGAIFLGIILALAGLLKPSLGLLILPLLMIIAINFLREKTARKFYLRGAIIITIFYTLTMLGWWYRNYQVFGEFVPLTTMSGFTLWESSGDGGNGGANHGKVIMPEKWQAMRANLANEPQNEIKMDQFLWRETLTLLAQDFPRTLKLTQGKFLRTWNFFPNWDGAQTWYYRAILAITYLPVIILALYSARLLYVRQRYAAYILFLPASYLCAVHLIFMGSLRYRLPAEGCLIILAASVIDWWQTKRTFNDLSR